MSSGRGRAPRRRQSRRPRSHLGIWALLGLIGLVGLFLSSLEYLRPHVTGDALKLNQFTDLVGQRHVQNATFVDFDAYIVGTYTRSDGTTADYNSPFLREGASDISKLLLANKVDTTIDTQPGKKTVQYAVYVLPALMLVIISAYLFLSFRRGSGLFSVRSGARAVTKRDTRAVTFADVAGQAAAIEELREIGQFLTTPDRFTRVGAEIPKGVLLYGPPGCGKTLLARALAADQGANFLSISGSDFIEIYVGVGAARVRDLFREARERAPSVIFIDELDSIGRRRGGGTANTVGSHPEQEQALNQILTEMDGFSTSEGIIVLAATNRPDVLDPALLRPGRFDRTIGLERPDEGGRLEILQLHARSKSLATDADLTSIARGAIGLNGADLASIVNEAALLAARDNLPAIPQANLEKALNRVLQAPDRQRRLSLRDRSFGRSFADEKDRVTFADVAGADDAVRELAEFRDYLAHPERFEAVGAAIPRGVLLAGPPGCGKTLLARAVAGETNAAFFSVAATQFLHAYVGEGAASVRDLFAEAREMAPAIVFIDEIDAVGGRRSSWLAQGGHDDTLNQILVELDGFTARAGVIVIAATNRPDRLDPALTRAGRFDRQVTVELPDNRGRRAILELYVRSRNLAADVDLDAVAGATAGLSGADLANIVNEAALLAARRGHQTVSRALLDQALERSVVGIASHGTLLTREERRIIAYHEAGHALVRRSLLGAGAVHKVSVSGSGHALGATWHHEDSDRQVFTRPLLMARMAGALAGRVAEEVALGEVGAGAASDIAYATHIARRMVREFGMGPGLGPISFADEMSPEGRNRPYSEQTAARVDEEVRLLIEEAQGIARQILEQSRSTLDAAALALVDREVITGKELDAIATSPLGAPSGSVPGPALPPPPPPVPIPG